VAALEQRITAMPFSGDGGQQLVAKACRALSVARHYRSTASGQGHLLCLLRACRSLQCIVGYCEGEDIFVGMIVSGAGIVHGFAPLRLPPGHQGDAHQQDDSVRWGRPSILACKVSFSPIRRRGRTIMRVNRSTSSSASGRRIATRATHDTDGDERKGGFDQNSEPGRRVRFRRLFLVTSITESDPALRRHDGVMTTPRNTRYGCWPAREYEP
jgi:hypothetical protein